MSYKEQKEVTTRKIDNKEQKQSLPPSRTGYEEAQDFDLHYLIFSAKDPQNIIEEARRRVERGELPITTARTLVSTTPDKNQLIGKGRAFYFKIDHPEIRKLFIKELITAFTSLLYVSQVIGEYNPHYLSFQNGLKKIDPLNIGQQVNIENQIIQEFILAHITRVKSSAQETIDALMECFFNMPYSSYEHSPPYSMGTTYYASKLRIYEDRYDDFLRNLIIKNCNELNSIRIALDNAFAQNPQLKNIPDMRMAEQNFNLLVRNVSHRIIQKGGEIPSPITLYGKDLKRLNSIKEICDKMSFKPKQEKYNSSSFFKLAVPIVVGAAAIAVFGARLIK